MLVACCASVYCFLGSPPTVILAEEFPWKPLYLPNILCLPEYNRANFIAFSIEEAPQRVKKALFKSPGQISANFLANRALISVVQEGVT
ncbi:hypothetical protein D3C86_582330 [compost metagenome]